MDQTTLERIKALPSDLRYLIERQYIQDYYKKNVMENLLTATSDIASRIQEFYPTGYRECRPGCPYSVKYNQAHHLIYNYDFSLCYNTLAMQKEEAICFDQDFYKRRSEATRTRRFPKNARYTYRHNKNINSWSIFFSFWE